ncbi:helix-turn-helix domain-containing protein [Fastidiosibacter lacustris]|uniref:helix-turn-helix domain-containing protein n=1 Tax=Fastidiosibacter lacustris TaxID=2056695 RepID=UPI001300662E|nr:helix-turn-helix domain-containing protein [Fastidiosibacter lacustris]
MSHIEKFIYATAEARYENARKDPTDQPRFTLSIVTEEVERGLIEATLAYTGFHLTNTAEVLGISSATLKAKIKKYGIFMLDFSS